MRKHHFPAHVRALVAGLFIAGSGSACAQKQESVSSSAIAFPTASAHQDTKLTSHIIDAPNGTYGYEVLSDGKLLIHQTNVPGRPGNNGCPTREHAQKLSALVIEKIQRGEMPPTVTTEELETLGL